MEQKPPLPHLTGEPIPEPEEMPPLPEASPWRRLQYFLFFIPHESRTNGEIVRWWEKRRLAYNGIVGAFGIVTVVVVGCSVPSNAAWGGILAGSAVIGVAANICYCAGWIVEIFLQRYFVRHRRYRVGRVLMNIGLSFSLFVVVTPGFITALLLMLGIIP
ncbi:MAG: hypothetical protein H8F28_23620 [Fibrella sp.]|nr:hypothetical protein [Armatimonadota bacterium]